MREGILGSLGVQAFVPWYVIDFMDVRVEPAPVQGQDVSGNAPFRIVSSTVTVRGRTLLDNGVATDPANGIADGTIAPAAIRGPASTVIGDLHPQKYTDAAYDMRIAVQFGPVP